MNKQTVNKNDVDDELVTVREAEEGETMYAIPGCVNTTGKPNYPGCYTG